ncbi:serine hydrolase domain-containing protein [Palleronia sp. KMU-117]|uniref:serine hydrolase domain-containing protein n=1 Tax=Palleronia sp. KMU-117 TaxID=3434108 RepID=UPI003D738A4A
MIRIFHAMTLACLLATPVQADAPEWAATSAFEAPPGAAPGASFAGTLALQTTQMSVQADPADGMIQTPWAWWGIFDFLAAQDPDGAVPLFELDATLFPGLPIDLVISDDGDVVPLERGVLRAPVAQRTPSFWELVASPGRSWELTGDAEQGWSRAAFPISLVQSQEGEAWIGLASFDYREGETTPLRVQLSSMSAGGFIFWDADFDVAAWAEVPFTLAPLEVDAGAIVAAHAAEMADRRPAKPLSELGAAFGAAAAALDPAGTLAVAVLSDGTLYMDAVETPFGPHPYPRDMRVGVWSVTKSLIPGLAAMRLAQKYGPDFLDTPVVSWFSEGDEFDYLDETARARWQEVTIRHALDMSTGMGATGYDPNWAMENLNTYAWSYSYALPDQIRAYFNVGPNPDVGGPGEAMAYIDQDMWIAALAMERFLKSKEGADATLLGLLEAEVYAPIGAGHFVSGTGYTETGAPGFPFSAWGALPTIDILARAGALVGNGGKGPDGSQILHPDLVAGLTASADYGLAFWRREVTSDSGTTIVPYMSGSGGNTVISLPNDMTIVVLGRDSYNVEISDEAAVALIEAARAVRPF